MNKAPIKRALISVSDKTGLESLAKTLKKFDVEIISSGGTGKRLKELGFDYTPIEQVTGNPEAFSGRMKTLSFQISSALLFRRESEEDQAQAKKLGIRPIDLVVCNLYPFEKVAKEENSKLTNLIENIDIGGPTMIRAAAKNYTSVAVCVGPSQYNELMALLEAGQGQLELAARKQFALEAFRDIAAYDALIASELEGRWESETKTFAVNANYSSPLRYGENPHQKAWAYKNPMLEGLAACEPLQGKALSYNNYLDADAAINCTLDLMEIFDQKKLKYAVTIIKHLNPCGAAIGADAMQALELAWAGDPISSFGSIISFSGEVNKESAIWLADKFVEVIIAEDFSPEALALFSQKKNLRLIKMPLSGEKKKLRDAYQLRSISGGYVIQTEDEGLDLELTPVTERPFPSGTKDLLRFGTMVNKHLKSNAIALVKQTPGGISLVGAGMGNPNRLISTEQALQKARENGEKEWANCVLISDAFFPFADNVEVAHGAGIVNIVQPGGSIKDPDVIAKCNELGVAMVFTGRRHFRH